MSEDLEKRNAELLALDADQRTLFLMSQADSCIQKLQENREMNESLRLEMQQNTAMTMQVMESTKGLVDAFNDTKKVAGWLSAFGAFIRRTAVYLTPIFTAMGAAYGLWKIILALVTNTPPPPPTH